MIVGGPAETFEGQAGGTLYSRVEERGWVGPVFRARGGAERRPVSERRAASVADKGRPSLVRHPGLAQTGEKRGLEQSADLRDPPII